LELGTTGGTKQCRELDEVARAWSGLLPVVKAGILAMIRTSATCNNQSESLGVDLSQVEDSNAS